MLATLVFNFHREDLDSDTADADAAEDAAEFQVGVEGRFVEHDHAAEHPHHHYDCLEDGHHLKLVVLLHRQVQTMCLRQRRQNHKEPEHEQHADVLACRPRLDQLAKQFQERDAQA